MPRLSPEQQLVIYRVTQESLSNVAQHAQARAVEVELSFVGRTVLRISDDGRGLPASNGARAMAASACRGCASARCWSADGCRCWSAPSEGTRVELTIDG